jgi:hypothetical protein
MPIYGGDPTSLSGGLSDDEVLALQAVITGNSNVRIQPDGTLQLHNTDSDKFNTPTTSGGDTSPSLDLGEAEV